MSLLAVVGDVESAHAALRPTITAITPNTILIHIYDLPHIGCKHTLGHYSFSNRESRSTILGLSVEMLLFSSGSFSRSKSSTLSFASLNPVTSL